MDANNAHRDSPAFAICDADAVPWITVSQMREVDRVAIKMGMTLARMMENAGAGLALVALAMLVGDVRDRRVVVLAGRGNNGGGGLVAARRLIGWGAQVDVRLSGGPDTLAPVAREQLEILDAAGTSVTVGVAGLTRPELMVDAILGYGQRGDPREGAADLIAATAGERVLSLDVPSGLSLQDGRVGAPAVRAEVTLTLALPKAAMRESGHAQHIGQLHLADLGVPPAVFTRLGIAYRTPFSGGPVVRLAGY